MSKLFDGQTSEVETDCALLGYRYMKVSPKGELKACVALRHRGWAPGWQTATCSKRWTKHAAPAPKCSCGFYAWYFPHDVAGYAGTWRLPVVIEGAGTLQLGENGFRAEQARVVAIAPGGIYQLAPRHSRWGRLSAEIRQRYPDAQIYPTQRAMVADWGPSRPGPVRRDPVQWATPATARLLAELGGAVHLRRRDADPPTALRRATLGVLDPDARRRPGPCSDCAGSPRARSGSPTTTTPEGGGTAPPVLDDCFSAR